MEDLNIAYLASEYPALSHTFIFREIQSLRKQGLKVHTCSIRKSENVQQMSDLEKEEAAQTYCIKKTPILEILGMHLWIFLLSPLGYWRMIKKTFKIWRRNPSYLIRSIGYLAEAGILLYWMREKKIKHIHVHFANPASTVTLIACRYGGISFSLSVHGPDAFYNVRENFIKEKLQAALFIRSISHYCQGQLMRLIPHSFWERIHIVRCGVDPEQFRRQSNPANAVPELLCVGRLVSAKGQHTLLQACRALADKNRPYHLTLVGDGEDRQSLEQLSQSLGIDQYITFTGAIGQDKVREYYKKADLFILPSFAEGVPVVLMEAMAAGVGVVSTRINGIPELIEHNKEGCLVPSSDVESLVKELQQLLDAPERREQLAEQGRKKVETLYNLEKNTQQMGSLFKQYLRNE